MLKKPDTHLGQCLRPPPPRPLPSSDLGGVENASLDWRGSGGLYSKSMPQCIKCGEPIPDKRKSIKYCSLNCSKLYLKSQYKKRKPEVVKAWKKKYYGEKGKKITAFTVKQTLEKYGGKCFRCGSFNDLAVHHWKPYKFGGTNEDKNLTVFCRSCHVKVHEEFNNGFWSVSKEEKWNRAELVGDGSIEDLEEMPPNPSDVLLYLEKEALET